ncbi:MAG: hypothetical protein QW734_06125 [Candidatus Bathyarchaeia archaeon]
MAVKRLEVVVPARVWERLEELEKRKGIRKEDILMRAVVKVLEEFEAE